MKYINVGLVNNMPGAALQATERQFRTLLDAAAAQLSEPTAVRLSVFALPAVPRSDEERRHIEANYSSINDLWSSRFDGVIITGTEPRAANLTDEPYWHSLQDLVEWAEHNTRSSIWSCLAAHAAVLQLDGISRRRLGEKLFGVFECTRISDHPMTANGINGSSSAKWHMPHSRWNEVPESALAACGYKILTRSSHAGVDLFVKQRRSLFVFIQGHPEYEVDSLLLEYRRDVRRFLCRERDSYPLAPHGYFDENANMVTRTFRERALVDRREQIAADFPSPQLGAKLRHSWQDAALSLYRNWLDSLNAEKRP